MVCSVRRFGVAALAVVALLGLLAPPAQAQSPFSMNPGLLRHPFGPVNAFGYNTAILGNQLAPLAPAILAQSLEARALNYGLGFNPVRAALATAPAAYTGLGTVAPYGGYGYPPYGYGGYGLGAYLTAANPYNGYLTGSAAITGANANWQVRIQEARLKREQARQASVDTRRKIIEEIMWEQKMRPTWNDLREKEQASLLRHYRNTASQTDIWSGSALNGIFEAVAKAQARRTTPVGPNIPLSDDILKKINLTSGATRGNVGLLKDDGNLNWPVPLEADEFTKARKELGRDIKDAVDQAKFGNRVEAGKIKGMYDYWEQLNTTLHNEVNRMSPSEYIRAQRYLNQVKDAIRAFEGSDVVDYYSNKSKLKSKNVAELVKTMYDKGLKFAPAVSGDEDAYTALYRALAAFDAGVTPVKPKYDTAPEGGGTTEK